MNLSSICPRVAVILVAFAAFAAFECTQSAAQPAGTSSPAAASAYQRIAPTPDGIGIAYMGREIAGVMDAAGADWLERGARVSEERPDLLIAALGLRQGMTVADVGAGTGFYSWRIADRVGPTGKVLAVDVQRDMLSRLETEMKQRGTTNVKPVLGTNTDPHLPAQSVDLVLMVDVYHEFDHPKEMLAGLVRSLSRDGRIAFVEYRAEDPAVPINPRHKMSEAQVRREATAAGLVWKQTVETLPWQHVVIFAKP